MTKICLVRHGETDWNITRRMQGRENIALNDMGRSQAENIGKYLKDQMWDILVSSPLKRALETAQIITEYICIKEIIVVEEFIERDFGLASGLTSQEARKRFPDGKIENMEEDTMLGARVMKALEVLLRDYENKNIIVITHGAVINSIISIVSANTVKLVKPQNGSISIVSYSGGRWTCEAYNLTKHFM